MVSLVATGLIVVAAACADGGDAAADLSPEAAEGRRIFNSAGCSGCHGSEGAGGVGPTLVGLPGSEVELTDGTTVVADDTYLVRSITEPDAQLVAGYSLRMPTNRLSETEVAAVIAYIEELEPSS